MTDRAMPLAVAAPLPAHFDPFTEPLSGFLVLEASAGTGKTWNLTALVLRWLIETDVTIDRLLVVTFTTAATAELRERIRQRLREVHAQWPDDDDTLLTHPTGGHAGGLPPPAADPLHVGLQGAARRAGIPADIARARLRRALHGFDEAAIHTLHGFCQRALAENPFSAGLPFRTDIMATDADALREAMSQAWKQVMAEHAHDPVLLAGLIQAGDSPERLLPALEARLGRPYLHERWPDAAPTPSPTPSPTPIEDGAVSLQTLWDQARMQWPQARTSVMETLLAAAGSLKANIYKGADTLDTAALLWDAWLAVDTALQAPAPSAGLDLLSASKVRSALRKGMAMPAHPWLDQADHLLQRMREAIAQRTRQRLLLLRRVLDEASRLARHIKHERRIQTFDDLLVHVADQVRPHPDGRSSALAERLRERYPVALIDEFQDTDPLQFEIAQQVWAPATGTVRANTAMVLVGDPKQAIYAFRHADLDTYLRARSLASRMGVLRENQRSVPALLAGLNHLFTRVPHVFGTAELPYVPVHAGQRRRAILQGDTRGPHAPASLATEQPQPAITAWMLPDGEQALSKVQGLFQAAEVAADQIVWLLGGDMTPDADDPVVDDPRGPHRVTVDGEPLRAQQIAVLVRTHRHAVLMRDVLAERGVDSVQLGRDPVFASGSGEDLLRILLALDTPADAGRVLAALATETLGLDATAIAALRADDTALGRWLEAFARWRQRWLQQGIAAALRRLVSDTDGVRRLLSRADGERRLTDLLHLFELLQQASIDHAQPAALLRWYRLMVSDPDALRHDPSRSEAGQLRLESDRDLVRIVTIHAAKGLEFDCVLCPFLAFESSRRIHSRHLAIEYPDASGPVLDYRQDAGQEPGIKERLNAAQEQEDMRLLYVALTRPVHRLWFSIGPWTQGGHARAAPSRKPSRRSAVNRLLAGVDMDDAHFSSQLHALGQGLPLDVMRCMPLPAPLRLRRNDRLSPTASDSLRARSAPAVPTPWRIGSFSALMASGARTGPASPEEPEAIAHMPAATALALRDPALEQGVDHDADSIDWTIELTEVSRDDTTALTTDITQAEPRSTPLDLFDFARGPQAGDCLHAVLERADFRDRTRWCDLADQALRRHLPSRREAEHTLDVRRIESMLDAVLSTPLPSQVHGQHASVNPGVWRLSDLDPAARASEWRFLLPVQGLDTERLRRLARALALDAPSAAMARLDGYLTGSIDLVCEHQGRWYVIDWKSNHLGSTPAAYHPDRLLPAMQAHGYRLQAGLYALAVHRHLKRRLAGYSPHQHWGGVLYLFLRGMGPDRLTAQGQPLGVFSVTPPANRSLTDWLDGLESLVGSAGAQPAA